MFASYSLDTKGIKRWSQAISLAQEKKTKLKGYNETRLWVINAIMY